MINRTILFLFLLPFFVSGQSYPLKPLNYVTDQSNRLSEMELSQLNRKLRVFEKETSSQIFVFMTGSLDGKDMTDLCQEIFKAWGIGGDKENNGVLVAVFVNDHQFRIHTGYGMEGALPDLLTKRIQDEEMRPYFKKNDYYGGINNGLDQLINYSKNEYQPEEEKEVSWIVYAMIINSFLFLVLGAAVWYRIEKKKPSKNTLIAWGIFVALVPALGGIILFVLILEAFDANILFSFYGSGRGGFSTGSAWGGGTTDSGSSWSDNSGSGSDYSSSSDSGFDGGGGGDSGGGGSSSDW